MLFRCTCTLDCDIGTVLKSSYWIDILQKYKLLRVNVVHCLSFLFILLFQNQHFKMLINANDLHCINIQLKCHGYFSLLCCFQTIFWTSELWQLNNNNNNRSPDKCCMSCCSRCWNCMLIYSIHGYLASLWLCLFWNSPFLYALCVCFTL